MYDDEAPPIGRDLPELISRAIEERPAQYGDVIKDILDAHLSRPDLIAARDIVELYEIISKLGTGARRIERILEELAREARDPVAAELETFSYYFDLVDRLDELLKSLNLAILDIYRPGLARAMAQIKWGDEEVYWHLRAIAPQYDIDRRTMPDSLKRVLNEWWYAGPRASFQLNCIAGVYGRPKHRLSSEAFERLHELCDGMLMIAQQIGEVVRANWRLSELAESGTPRILLQGDYFANVEAGATIVNRSLLADSVELLGRMGHTGEQGRPIKSIEQIAQRIEREGDRESGNLFNDLLTAVTAPVVSREQVASAWTALTSYRTELLGKTQLRQIANMIDGLPGINDRSTSRAEETMGDVIKNIGAGATVINRSSLNNSLNKVDQVFGEDIRAALQRLADVVDESGNQEAVENFNAFNEELGREEPRKSILKSFWLGLVATLPAVDQIAEIGEKLQALF